MFSLNSIKIFLVLVLLGCQSCSLWRSKTDGATPNAPVALEELKSEIPFSNKEPETFQTEIVVVAAGGAEEKIFVAKSGANRLTIFDYQKTNETRVLETGGSGKLTIAPGRKIYVENQTTNAEGSALFEFLTAELLARKPDARFEALGAENNLAKYRVDLDDAQQSEIIIYVDERIGLPVRQEFHNGGEGEQKKITFAVELKNFSLQTNAGFFEVPKDYRKVSLKEFREIIRRGQDKNDKRAE